MSTFRKMMPFVLVLLSCMVLAPAVSMADPGGEEHKAHDSGDNDHSVGVALAIAAGFGLGIAAAGGGMAQGRTAAAALEAIGRNPGASDKIFTPMILGLALIESLVIYSLVISFMLVGKIG